MSSEQPFIASEKQLPELTLKVMVLSLLLTIILAAANAYLALKIGWLTSASIPAAILSMGILRGFKNSNILENNLVQTAASAGEAVSGGIVYTIPALVIIHYWINFPYWQNVAIAFVGGTLGILLSVPIRKRLVSEPSLPFPEGRAIAEVLQAGSQKIFRLTELLWGSALGLLIELLQTGLKILASSWQYWTNIGSSVIGVEIGFSPAMLGAGFLMGPQLAGSILIGAVLAFGFGMPIATSQHWSLPLTAQTIAQQVWDSELRYVGIAALIIAGLFSLTKLIRPLIQHITLFLGSAHSQAPRPLQAVVRTERDLPLPIVGLGLVIFLSLSLGLVLWIVPLWHWPMTEQAKLLLLVAIFGYLLIMGFIFVTLCGYFSGLVGVSASPGSAIMIAGVVLAALGLVSFVHGHDILSTPSLHITAAALAILIGALITGMACIANDNIQDLKVGFLIGATPWKQQVMLLFGVAIAALVIPLVMNTLFNAYGIAGVLPHPHMNPSASLAAPPAAMMAALTQSVFLGQLPWHMLAIGAGLIVILAALRNIRCLQWCVLLGVALGMYLPLSVSLPLCIGGGFRFLLTHQLATKNACSDTLPNGRTGILFACGLVAGAAICDVLLAIPFALLHNPEVLRVMPADWHSIAVGLSIAVTIGLGVVLLQNYRKLKE